MNRENKKIELSSQEREYISGLLEAHRSKIDLLDEKYKRQESIRKELRTTERLERKLAF